MNIILGATGQVGSAITNFLIKKGLPVKAVIHDKEKAKELSEKGIETAIADYFDGNALKEAVKGGDIIFLITPETGQTENVLGDTRRILENYREAIHSSNIRSLIAISSIGAQFDEGTGNLLMSNMLEQAFENLKINKLFVRPSYYYSNWLMSLDMVKENGLLPTFFPPDMKLNMVSPIDVAEFIANKIESGINKSEMIELVGPREYSSNDIVEVMGKVLDKQVETIHIPKEKWMSTMKEVGFSDDAARNFAEMTQAVVEGKIKPEGNPIALKTTFEEFLIQSL